MKNRLGFVAFSAASTAARLTQTSTVWIGQWPSRMVCLRLPASLGEVRRSTDLTPGGSASDSRAAVAPCGTVVGSGFMPKILGGPYRHAQTRWQGRKGRL